jgi:hypothetical protein
MFSVVIYGIDFSLRFLMSNDCLQNYGHWHLFVALRRPVQISLIKQWVKQFDPEKS